MSSTRFSPLYGLISGHIYRVRGLLITRLVKFKYLVAVGGPKLSVKMQLLFGSLKQL